MKTLALLLVAAVGLSFSGCGSKPKKPNLKAKLEHKDPQPHRKTVRLTGFSDGSYGYQDDLVWYYLIYSNDTNRTLTSVSRSMDSPASRGLTVNSSAPAMERIAGTPVAGERAVPDGQTEQEDLENDAQVEAENAQIDAENSQIDVENAQAIEAFENEGGNLGSESESSGSDGTDSSGGDSSSSGGDSGGD